MSNELPRAELIRQVDRAMRAHGTASDALDEAAITYLGVNRTDGRCLDILDQRGRMTAGELAQVMGLSTGAITAVLDRLEKAGYARRVRGTKDRRCVLVELTEQARARAWETYGPLAGQWHDQLSRLTDEQLVLIRDFLAMGCELVAEHAARVKAMCERSVP